MNDKLSDNSRADDIARKLDQVAEQTTVNSQFAAELEERLRNAHEPKTNWFTSAFKQVSPALRWTALMVLLGLVLSLSIKTLIPAPQPAANDTPTIPDNTPAPEDINTPSPPLGETFDYGGAQLIMNIPFPDSPGQTNVYAAFRAQPATTEYVQALAAQFGIEGQLYTNPTMGLAPDEAPLMVTDGKQELLVYSRNNYLYTSDRVRYSRSYTSVPNENAEAIIREYMRTHGFDFDFRFDAEGGAYGGYVLRQLSPDGLPMTSDTQGSTRVTLDKDGNVLSVSISTIDYEPASLGTFEILTAEEALQQMLSETLPGGSMESSGSGPDPSLAPPQYWYHDYPDNQTVTVYGNITVYPAVDPNTPAILFLENVPVTGSTGGMEALNNYTFIQATGQFVIENGVRKLSVESWNRDIQMICVSGSARRAGEQIIITDEGENVSEYMLVEPPADLPLDTRSALPDSQLVSCGAAIDGQFHWTSIQFYTDTSQMGGGGGGGGFFYELNLSGTPVPFPTAAPSSSAHNSAESSAFPKYIVRDGDTLQEIAASYNISAEEILQANGMTDPQIAVGSVLIIPVTRLEEERGTVDVQVFEKPDGRRRTSYTFVSERDQMYYQLKGDNLEVLQETANRPIEIWGDLSVDEAGAAFLTMEKFEPLYPDLQFQVLTGTQTTKELNGERVILFTTGGTTYIQLDQDGGYPDRHYYEDGKEVNIEVLQIPDETYAGYPALRVFQMMPTSSNPATGTPTPVGLPRTANTIEVLPDPFGNADSYTPPSITIEKVELMYYVSDPSYYDETLEPAPIHLQPVWYFYGHNENGDEVNIYIQALRQEYLLPETE
ncbi:MAG: LysM peptidoglycan-binding domain-containing protein [Anaerolineales bacterium]|nr:LysM peptidoglycan-binding domain-containing protein [Anaerolineales bacterium]